MEKYNYFVKLRILAFIDKQLKEEKVFQKIFDAVVPSHVGDKRMETWKGFRCMVQFSNPVRARKSLQRIRTERKP
jgi:hypothetical protein